MDKKRYLRKHQRLSIGFYLNLNRYLHDVILLWQIEGMKAVLPIRECPVCPLPVDILQQFPVVKTKGLPLSVQHTDGSVSKTRLLSFVFRESVCRRSELGADPNDFPCR